MAWKFGLVYVDYDGNRSTTNHTVAPAEADGDTGTAYDAALAIASGCLTNAQAHSLSDVYLVGPTFDRGNVYLKSSDIDAKNAVQLKVVLDLDGKTQKGAFVIPGIQETLVRGTDRKVNNATVLALALVQRYIVGELVVSDGDLATGVADADIITKRSLVTE